MYIPIIYKMLSLYFALYSRDVSIYGINMHKSGLASGVEILSETILRPQFLKDEVSYTKSIVSLHSDHSRKCWKCSDVFVSKIEA